ncbi:MAG: DUF4867 family protein [Acholeplasmataceae bacterium]|nr:DUF4867 family protein [Acholeplasmataceae bacterium]
MLQNLKQNNPKLDLYHINDNTFTAYGKILDFKYFEELKTYMIQHTQVPEKENIYVAHDEQLALSITDQSVFNDVFGNVRLQYGFVNGNNSKLNALEYHKSSEINIAITPLILLLGHASDIKNRTYDSSQLKAFYIPENTAIELYPMTLHFSPSKVSNLGFKCGVILPYGTNMEFVTSKLLNCDEDYFLFKTNKWLIAHQEHIKMIHLGAYVGITGPNIEIKY